MEAIQTDKAPKAIGPYSQAVKEGGFVFASGQIALDPKTGVLVDGGVSAQAEQVLSNLRSVLVAAGTDLNKVVKTTIYLRRMEDFQTVNEIYARYFTEPYPARATVAAAGLPKDALVEIEAIAKG